MAQAPPSPGSTARQSSTACGLGEQTSQWFLHIHKCGLIPLVNFSMTEKLKGHTQKSMYELHIYEHVEEREHVMYHSCAVLSEIL